MPHVYYDNKLRWWQAYLTIHQPKLIENQLQDFYFFPFTSTVPEMRAEVGSFPGIILHPPLPSLMHPQDNPTKPHQQSTEAEPDSSQTSLEPSPSALSGSMIGPPPPLLLQSTPPYEHKVDTETSKIQNSTAQLSTVFSVWHDRRIFISSFDNQNTAM